MPLYQRDYDQAARYLRYAGELLAQKAAGKTTALRELLEEVAQRLSPGGAYGGDLSTEIELMRSAAAQVKTINPYVADARTEILKAVSVLRDGAAT